MIGTFLDALSVLHLLRPWVLVALLPLGLIWWFSRRMMAAANTAPSGIAPHLAAALTVGGNERSRWQPVDGAAIVLTLLIVATSGPTWSRVPNPFLSQTAPMMVVLEVTRSMEAPDLQPSRLERATFKIMDLVERRAGARTGLVAYASSAHRVTPLTEDPEILRVMLAGLGPDVMPGEGNNASAALNLARQELAKSETPGAILLVTDGVDAADAQALAQGEGDATVDTSADAPVIVLFAAPDNEPLGATEGTDATVIRLTADDSDLDQIERQAASAYRAALLGDERLDWEDRGWMLAWPAALLLLFWFRQGWTMRWALVLMALGLGGLPAGQARAGVADWFFTPDQQGMMAFRDHDNVKAIESFQDPMWRAHAMMKNGQYSEAADVFSRIDTPDAAFAEGYAHIRNRAYRPAIAAYERALEMQPDFPEATRNLEVTKVILEYVESSREAGDTGEEAGLGADDVVYDNEEGRGADTQKEYGEEDDAPKFTTSEQWMRSVDTEMGDFLKSRFRLEAAQVSE